MAKDENIRDLGAEIHPQSLYEIQISEISPEKRMVFYVGSIDGQMCNRMLRGMLVAYLKFSGQGAK